MGVLEHPATRRAPELGRPPFADPYTVRRREAAYRCAAVLCSRAGARRVADLGCGDGFGAALLAAAGAEVIAFSDDDIVLEVAERTYRSPRVAFRRTLLPLTDEPEASFDAAVCWGLLERLADTRPLVGEIERLLRPGGLVVVATPNRLRVSPGRTRPIADGRAWEYTPDELRHLLRWRFGDVRLWGISHGRRLTIVERLCGEPLPVLLHRVAPSDRSAWLRWALGGLRPRHFRVASARLAGALDLVGAATR